MIFGLVPLWVYCATTVLDNALTRSSIGDFLDSILAVVGVYRHAMNAKVGPVVGSQMTANIVIDALIGLVPFLGDIADGFYKSNTKNYALLLEVLVERSAENEKAEYRRKHLQSPTNHTDRSRIDMEKQALKTNPTRPHHDKTGHGGNKASTTMHPTVPQPAKVEVEKIPKKGWFSRFNGAQTDGRDLEMGEAPSLQVPRSVA